MPARTTYVSDGWLSLDHPGGLALRQVTAGLTLRRGDQAETLRLPNLKPIYRAEGELHEFTAETDGLQVVWRIVEEGDDLRLALSVTNQGKAPLSLDWLDVFDADAALGGVVVLPADLTSWRFYQNGWVSWTPTFARVLRGGLYIQPTTPGYTTTHQSHFDPAKPAALRSEWVSVLYGPAQVEARALLLSFVTAADQLSEIRLDAGDSFQRLTARCYLDGVPLPPGETITSEALLLRIGADPLALLESYADELGERMEARVGEGPPPTGWCSWYYFYGQDKASDVLANVEAIERQRLDLDVILVDDGYQTALGDWLSIDPRKYPDGMAAVAQAVDKVNRRAGIWTAPFGVQDSSQVFKDHPDWALRDAAGEPVLGWRHNLALPCYGLDLTHPDVLKWLEETFRVLRGWGYTFFKIDFLFAGGLPGVRHDRAATRAQALRRGLEAIRRGIGEESYLLGCGTPLGPCVGIVDGMRIGPDVSPTWAPLWDDLSMPSAGNAMRNAMTRAYMHNRLWHNDPDCLIVRSRHDQSSMVLNEMRSMVSIVALLGGLTLDSDHVPKLGIRERIKYLQQTLPPTDQAARVVDMFANENPGQLVLEVDRTWGKHWVVGLLNWGDVTRTTRVALKTLGIPPGEYHVYNYWLRRYEGVVSSEDLVVGRHQPRETRVLGLRPVSDEPRLLTSTFHVSQGGAEIISLTRRRRDGSLIIRLDLVKPGEQFGQLLFTVPEGWRAAEARVNGNLQHPTTEADGVIGLGFTLLDLATVTIRFIRENHD